MPATKTRLQKAHRSPRKAPYNGKKLTWKQVDEIKDLLNFCSIKEIAKTYKVHYTMIGHIKCGRCWARV